MIEFNRRFETPLEPFLLATERMPMEKLLHENGFLTCAIHEQSSKTTQHKICVNNDSPCPLTSIKNNAYSMGKILRENNTNVSICAFLLAPHSFARHQRRPFWCQVVADLAPRERQLLEQKLVPIRLTKKAWSTMNCFHHC